MNAQHAGTKWSADESLRTKSGNKYTPVTAADLYCAQAEQSAVFGKLKHNQFRNSVGLHSPQLTHHDDLMDTD